MVAYLLRVPAGIAGDVTRKDQATIEAQVVDSTTPPTRFGEPVKIVTGKVQPFASGDAASVVYGFLVRPYPAHSTQDGLGTSTPNTAGICNVLVRGYINTLLRNGTAALNGQVYVRNANASGLRPIGGIEATSDSGNCVAITGAVFTGAADASGNVEIRFNI